MLRELRTVRIIVWAGRSGDRIPVVGARFAAPV